MNNFTISQLQQFSGIKAHTIRIWEQRYQALQPNRSDGNTRYYDNTQLKRLLNIVSLLNNGYKVSELCLMPDEKLFQIIQAQLKNIRGDDKSAEYYISQMIAAGMCFDGSAFEKLFYICLQKYDVRNAYIKIIYPMLVRLGLMWATDTLPPAHEHFISNFLKQKLFTAIDGLPQKPQLNDRWLLFLPENEFHEIGLLFSTYVIKSAGGNVFYLGSSLPYDTLLNAVNEIKPANLLLFLVLREEPDAIEKYLSSLVKNIKANIYVAASNEVINKIEEPKSFRWLKSVEELEAVLNKRKNKL
jgi:DNA-binding transcriptional MerR regulator